MFVHSLICVYVCSLKCIAVVGKSAFLFCPSCTFCSMEEGVAPEGACVPCSYRDRVFLDQLSVDSWVITDIVLQKQHKLGAGTFQLEFDETGHNCIVQAKYDCNRFFDGDDTFGEL